MIIAVEIDRIISTPARTSVALTDAEHCTVLPEAKDALVKLKEKGHEIHIFTRRDVSLAMATEMWLQKNKIPYDRLVPNKPEYHIIVDTVAYKFQNWPKFFEDQKYRIENG